MKRADLKKKGPKGAGGVGGGVSGKRANAVKGGSGRGKAKTGRKVTPARPPRHARPATVYFVGSGPGDPDLITVKGAKALKEADVIVYAGSLVSAGVLKHCRRSARIHNSASMDLVAIMSVIVRAAKEGKRVVRLHSGDPSLYGAIGEQAAILERESIPYGVIPGVSSAFAAAAALKKELTVPGVTQTVIFTRLEGRTPVPDSESLSSLSTHNATICVFLSASMIERVAEELLTGYPPETPAAVVYRASWEDEMVIRGALKDIAAKSREAGINRQALVIVGKALGEEEISGMASKLYDRGFTHSYRGR